MRQKWAIFAIIFFSFFNLNLIASNVDSIRVGVISDPHYLSTLLMDNNNPYLLQYEQRTGKAISKTPDILNLALNNLIQKNIDVLFVSGDLTKDGELQSHLDFARVLKHLNDVGIKVFVIPGNHDINMPNSLAYNNDTTDIVKNITDSDFLKIYFNYGYKDAIATDSVSLSYLAAINPNTWLLAIDSNRYKDYTTHSLSGGRIQAETLQWIIDILERAKREKIRIIGMMHHGLVEHFPYQSTFFSDYLIDDWENIATIFANSDMQLIFTGHFHANDISEFSSSNNKKIYDVETGSLAAYPFPYRIVDISAEKADIVTYHIKSLPNYLNLEEENKRLMENVAEKIARNRIKNLGVDLPDSITADIVRLAKIIAVKHMAGDEVLSTEDQCILKRLRNNINDDSINNDTTQFNLDFYPPDNNVTIELTY